MKVAITGSDGILGTALRPYFPNADWLSRASCDVSNPGSVRNWFSHRTYDMVVHCGAVTSGTAGGEALVQTNILGTAHVLNWARKQGARFVYLSTDYVYPGTGRHKETDSLNPHGPYAWSKLGGECVTRSYWSSVIIRGSWYDTITNSAAATDAYQSKIPVQKAAMMVATISNSTHTGVFNIGDGRRSLWEIAVSEFNPSCRPIARKDITHIPYTVPFDVSLDTTRYREAFGR